MTQAASLSGPAAQGEGGDASPLHVAIIMDGNGRWAKSRGLPRTAGHERGVEALRRTVEAAGELGVSHLTVFSFSTENWRRPVSEVSALFGLLRSYVKRDLTRLKEEGVRIRVIGQRDNVPDDINTLIKKAESETASNTRFHLTIAFNYGARDEIVRAARRAMETAAANNLPPSALTEDVFNSFLDTRDLPDPDLLIRTSGETRISNFLLWQLAYSELVFVDVLWPDFGKSQLSRAIEVYKARERRFGAVGGAG